MSVLGPQEMEVYDGQYVLQEVTKYFNFALIVVEIIIIMVILRYKRLRKHKSLVVLLNLSFINIFALSLPFILYKYDNLQCKVHYIVDYIVHSFETILITGILFKSYMNLVYPSCSINQKTLIHIFYFFYILLAMSVISELVTDCDNKIISFIFYSSVSATFIILAIMHNISYAYIRGWKEFFCVKEVDFLLTNTYLICSLPLMVNLILFHFTRSCECLYPCHNVALIIYNLKSTCFFIALYNFNSDFNLCFKKIFCCPKNDDINHRVIFNNSITIINVYSSSKI